LAEDQESGVFTDGGASGAVRGEPIAAAGSLVVVGVAAGMTVQPFSIITRCAVTAPETEPIHPERTVENC
jgi:hypothetical protein